MHRSYKKIAILIANTNLETVVTVKKTIKGLTTITITNLTHLIIKNTVKHIKKKSKIYSHLHQN